MKLIGLFLILNIVQLTASVYSQNSYFELEERNLTLKETIKEIENQTGYRFAYRESFIEQYGIVKTKRDKMTVEEFLENVVKSIGFDYLILEDYLVVLTIDHNKLLEQEITIKGKVTDKDGTPLPGVNILEKGTTNGAVTNLDGEYNISVSSPGAVLSFSYVGFLTEEIEVGSGTTIDLTLVEDIMTLDEVVVTALGIEREKKALGFAAQELNENDLSASRETNLASLLTAKVAGVQIAKTGSGTGGSSSVIIRGVSSLSGSNQPLFVVDGVPIINNPKDASGDGGLFGDNDYGDGIGDINPEDIASISVLKGPNASALYGSRGANGVILVTTKSGKASKGIRVEVNSNVSWETLNLIPTFQNYYATGYEETNIYGGMVDIGGNLYETMDTWHVDSWGPPLDGRRVIVDPFVYPEDANTRTLTLLPQPEDNVRNFYETGFVNTNTVAFTGGNEKINARLSLGNSYMKGIVPNARINKQTVTLRTTSQVTDYLSFDTKVSYIHTDGKQRPAMGNHPENVSRTLALMGRYVPLPWLKEYYETTGLPGRWPGISHNPYFIIDALKNNDYRDRLLGYTSATLTFTSWLSLMGRVGIDVYSESREKRWPVGSINYGGIELANGRLTNEFYHNKDINADAILTANKELSNSLTGTFSLGGSYLSQRRDMESIDARSFKAKDVYHVNNARQYFPGSSLWQKEMQSVFFMGQLAYKNYLFFDVTGRNDWSSALGRNNYSFFYPSVASSFVFTDLVSVNKNVLSFGKIRVSWAQVGNDSEPYQTLAGYESYTTGYAGLGLASNDGTIPLFDLKNELTESWEVGTDLRFFQNRIGLDVTYYNGHTTNQILPITVSNASGYSTKVINAGRIDNKGIEAVLNLTPLQIQNVFRWDITANFAKNTSEVVELAPGVETYVLASTGIGEVEARIGEPFGNIVGTAYKRAPDGQKIVSDGGAYVGEDRVSVLGNIQPDWTGGLNNTFAYKGFSLNFLLDFKLGGEIISETKWLMNDRGTGKFTEKGRKLRDTDDEGNQLPYVGVLDGVVEQKDGEGNVIGYEKNTLAVTGYTYWGAWSGIDEPFVLDGSYISLREVMLSYSLPQAVLSRMPFSGLTMTVVGRNLLYLVEHMEDMGVSPETHPNTDAAYLGIETYSQPTTRTFGLNVKVTF